MTGRMLGDNNLSEVVEMFIEGAEEGWRLRTGKFAVCPGVASQTWAEIRCVPKVRVIMELREARRSAAGDRDGGGLADDGCA
jgi:hypothetical protein